MATPDEVIQATIDSVFVAIENLTFEQKREVMIGLGIAAQQQLSLLNQVETAAQVAFAQANPVAFAAVRDAALAQAMAELEPPPPEEPQEP